MLFRSFFLCICDAIAFYRLATLLHGWWAFWCWRVLLRRRRSVGHGVDLRGWLELEARRGARDPSFPARSAVAADRAAGSRRCSSSSASSATDPKAARVWRCCGARGASATAVHRQEPRRGAAGSPGDVFQGTKVSQAVEDRRMLLFVSVAGDAGDPRACSGSSPSCLLFLCLFLCTLYVESW